MVIFKSKQKKYEGDFKIKLCGKRQYLTESVNCLGVKIDINLSCNFCSILELLLNINLGHFLIIEKTFVLLFTESAIKPTPLLHANIQRPWHTECNQSKWWWPECFYEPDSSVTTPKSGQPKLSIRNVHQSHGWQASMLGQINLQLMEELGCSKRLTGDCTTMNS